MTITRREFVAGAAGTAGLVSMPCVAKAQQTINLTIASSHPVINMWVAPMKNVFQPEVDRLLAAGGKFKINWKEAYGGTLYKFQDTMAAVRDDITDIGFVGTVWEGDTMPLQNVTFFTPFATNDHKLLISIFDKMTAENPKMQEGWTKNNMVYLASSVTDPYDIYSNFPIKSLDDLKNRKINAPGTSANWLRGTGAVPVDGALTTYYTNIQTGVTEGALSFAVGILPTRVYEVAKYITRVNIGSMYVGGIAMNKSVFDKQPREVQEAVRAAGKLASQKHGEDISNRVDSALDEMVKKHGAILTTLPAAEREKWIKGLPNVARTWTDANGQAAKDILKAYFDALRAAGGKPGRDWDKEVG
jgi:TRAP-type C4-dicarboxylate transport system substrate-binding protein